MPDTLPPDQWARVQSFVTSGEFADEAAVVSAALDLLERRRRLQALIQEGIDDADRGNLVDGDEAFAQLREKLAAMSECPE